MPIVRRTTRDPLTGPPSRFWAPGLAARPDDPATDIPVGLASSAAAIELQSQVEIYCRRRITGRSVLIGGERGSGKTTLAGAVIDKVLRGTNLASDVRPLFVPIHGPDFFDGVEPVQIVPWTDETPKGSSDQAREQTGARFALKVLTTGLHRAFATEIGWALERAARGIRPPASDASEIIAQLRLDLDGDVDTSTLRWIWDQVGALDVGVLGRDARIATETFGTKQGLLEILALKSLIEAYIRVAGKVETLTSTSMAAELKLEASSQRAQSLANVVAGVLTGGAAGAGIFLQAGSAPAKALMAALAIPLTSFLSTALLNVATKASVERKRSEERKVTFDKSLESLDLLFPLLVNRVLDAGRAPVFVIDELDKVHQAPDRLGDLIPRLKHIVSDKAFFCFLVDRDCYDKIQVKITEAPYGPASTFFSRRLFVNLTPNDWREHLIGSAAAGKSLIESIKDNTAIDPLLTSSATDSALRATDASVLFTLSYYLLARSRMHAGNLQRLVDSQCDRESYSSTQRVFTPPDLDRPHFKNQIIYQAAVEFVLRNPQIATRVNTDPAFRQALYDRLYEPLTLWERGAIFVAEPPDRRTIETPKEPSSINGPPSLLVVEKSAGSATMPADPDHLLLQSAVGQLLNLLEQPAPLVSAAPDTQAGVVDSDLAQVLSGTMPLVTKGPDGALRWLVDFWGRAIEKPVIAPLEQEGNVAEKRVVEQVPQKKALAMIDAVFSLDAFLRDSSEGRLDLNKLANSLRLLDLSPQFSSFSSSANRYLANIGKSNEEGSYPDMSGDKSLIVQYYDLVDRAMNAIILSAYLALLVSKLIPGPVTSLRIVNCWREIAEELQFADFSGAAINAIFGNYKSEMAAIQPYLDAAEKSRANKSRGFGESWLDKGVLSFLHEESTKYTAALSKDAESALFNNSGNSNIQCLGYYFERFDALVRSARDSSRMRPPSLFGLLLRARDIVGPFHGFPTSIALGAYARVLSEAYAFGAADFRLAAIAELGFGSEVLTYQFDGSVPVQVDSAEKLIEIARLRSFKGERVLLLLREDPPVTWIGEEKLIGQDTPAAPHKNWPPSSQHAVFPVFAKDLDKVPVFLWNTFTLALSDGISDMTASLNANFSLSSQLPPTVPTVRLLTRTDAIELKAALAVRNGPEWEKSGPLGSRISVAPYLGHYRELPEIIDPASLDEAIALARQLSSTNSAPPPAAA